MRGRGDYVRLTKIFFLFRARARVRFVYVLWVASSATDGARVPRVSKLSLDFTENVIPIMGRKQLCEDLIGR